MKKQILTFAIAVMILIFISACSQSKKTTDNNEVVTVDSSISKQDTLIEAAEVKPFDGLMHVNESEFQKLAWYIEKNGHPAFSTQNDFPDYEYSFKDSDGNIAALIVMYKNKATVNHIVAWAYRGGIRDEKHFFYYIIERDKMFVDRKGYVDTATIKKNYSEFLAKASQN